MESLSHQANRSDSLPTAEASSAYQTCITLGMWLERVSIRGLVAKGITRGHIGSFLLVKVGCCSLARVGSFSDRSCRVQWRKVDTGNGCWQGHSFCRRGLFNFSWVNISLFASQPKKHYPSKRYTVHGHKSDLHTSHTLQRAW